MLEIAAIIPLLVGIILLVGLVITVILDRNHNTTMFVFMIIMVVVFLCLIFTIFSYEESYVVSNIQEVI